MRRLVVLALAVVAVLALPDSAPAQAVVPPEEAAGLRAALVRAEALFDDEQFDLSREQIEPWLERVAANAPQRPALVALQADLLWRSGDLERSGSLYREALAARADLVRARVGLTRFHLACGETEAALEVSQQGLESGARSAESWLAWAAALIRAERYPEAIAARERALQILGARRAGGKPPPRQLAAALEVVRAAGLPQGPLVRDGRAAKLEYDLKGGVPVTTIELTGKGGTSRSVPMVIDTGGSFLVGLDAPICAALELTGVPGTPVLGLHREPVEAEVAVVPVLTLGAWRALEVPALFYPVLPDPDRPAGEQAPYEGVLGTALLDGRVLSFHTARQVCMLTPGKSREGPVRKRRKSTAATVPFWRLGDGKIVLEVECEGTRCLALLDSGAASSSVSDAFARSHGRGPAVQSDATTSRPLKVVIGGRILPFAPLAARRSIDDVVSPRLGAEISLLIGMDFIQRCRRVAVDYANQRVSLHVRDR